MTKKRIKYIGMYDTANDTVQRFHSLAGVNKMNYIISVLNEIGYDVDIYSLAKSKEHKFRYTKEQIVQMGKNTLYLPPTFGANNKLTKALRICLLNIWLILRLCQHAKKDEVILVYHTLEGISPLSLFKKIKRVRYILEVEEIYGEISGINNTKEIDYISEAYKYIVVSDMLRKKLPPKDSICIYGNYKTGKGNNISTHDSGRINMLFSGSLDAKRGVHPAVESMYYLPDNYFLNISGTDTPENINKLKERIESLNRKKGKEVCKYHGCLSLTDYNKLLGNTDIALNTQIAGTFGQYLFPSKLLSYMKANLHIVSTKGNSIVSSPFADRIHFADDFSPESIAKAILRVDLGMPENNEAFLSELHEKTKSELKKLIEA